MKKLKKLRLKNGLTQKELAEKANVPYEWLHSLESRPPKRLDLYRMAKIAKALNAELKDILDERPKST